MPETASYLATVQTGDDPTEQETELVTISYPDGLPVIEAGDVRITAVEAVGENEVAA